MNPVETQQLFIEWFSSSYGRKWNQTWSCVSSLQNFCQSFLVWQLKTRILSHTWMQLLPTDARRCPEVFWFLTKASILKDFLGAQNNLKKRSKSCKRGVLSSSESQTGFLIRVRWERTHFEDKKQTHTDTKNKTLFPISFISLFLAYNKKQKHMHTHSYQLSLSFTHTNPMLNICLKILSRI